MQKIKSRLSSKPYYAVIFTSTLTNNTEGYSEMGQKMVELAKKGIFWWIAQKLQKVS